MIISRDKNYFNSSNDFIDDSIKILCNQLNETFQCNFTEVETETFDNILDLLQHKGNFPDNKVNESLIIKINEQQKMIYSTICTGNLSAINNIIKQYVTIIGNLDTEKMQSFTADLLVVIRNKLQESSIDISNSILIKEWDKGLNRVHTLNTSADIQLFLTKLLDDLVKYVKGANLTEFDVIEQAKKYIAENITKDFSLEDISEKFYMSQYYFSRIFKEKTGENFIDFVIHNKMEYAIKLLKMPQYKVYEISNEVGYKSIRYFTKTFKNFTGYTPTAYRKLLHSNKEVNKIG